MKLKKTLKLDLFLFNFRYAGRLKAKKREMVVESDFHHKEKVLNHSLSQMNFFTRVATCNVFVTFESDCG